MQECGAQLLLIRGGASEAHGTTRPQALSLRRRRRRYLADPQIDPCKGAPPGYLFVSL